MARWVWDLVRGTLGLELRAARKAIDLRQKELLESKAPIDRRLRIDDAQHENTQILEAYFSIQDRIQALLGVMSVLLVLFPIGIFQIPIGPVSESTPAYKGSTWFLSWIYYGYLSLAGVLLFAAVLICLQQIPHRRIYFPDLDGLETPRKKLGTAERLVVMIFGYIPLSVDNRAEVERETQEYLKCIELNGLEVVKANNALSQANEFLRDSLWCLTTAGIAFGAANLLHHLVQVWLNTQ